MSRLRDSMCTSFGKNPNSLSRSPHDLCTILRVFAPSREPTRSEMKQATFVYRLIKHANLERAASAQFSQITGNLRSP